MGVAAGGVVLVLTAFTFDAAPLLVAGIAFTVLGLGVPAWVWLSARQATVRRELLRDRVIEGEQFEATIEVRRGVLALPGAELHDPLAPSPVSLSLPLSLLHGGRTTSVRIVSRFARRGLLVLDPPQLIVRDPLELAQVKRPGTGRRQELLVLPYTEPVQWNQRRRGRHPERAGGRTPGDPLAAVDIDGLRPYQRGTPASRIHWPALARGGELLERRLRADGDTRPLVVLDARCSGPPEPLDAAVRAAASLTRELARLAGCRLLLPGDRRALTIESDLVSWPAAHARLALVEGGPGTRAPMLDAATRLGPVFYVAARPVDRLPPALTGSGRAAALLVVPHGVRGVPGSTPSFEVAGCCGYLLRAGAFSNQERVA